MNDLNLYGHGIFVLYNLNMQIVLLSFIYLLNSGTSDYVIMYYVYYVSARINVKPLPGFTLHYIYDMFKT